MQLFRLNMNLGKGRKTTNPSLMLSFPRPGIAEISFSIWHKKEPGTAPAGSVKGPAACPVCRAHFWAGLNDPCQLSKGRISSGIRGHEGQT